MSMASADDSILSVKHNLIQDGLVGQVVVLDPKGHCVVLSNNNSPIPCTEEEDMVLQQAFKENNPYLEAVCGPDITEYYNKVDLEVGGGITSYENCQFYAIILPSGLAVGGILSLIPPLAPAGWVIAGVSGLVLTVIGGIKSIKALETEICQEEDSSRGCKAFTRIAQSFSR